MGLSHRSLVVITALSFYLNRPHPQICRDSVFSGFVWSVRDLRYPQTDYLVSIRPDSYVIADRIHWLRDRT